VEATSTAGQGSRRAVQPSDDDDDDESAYIYGLFGVVSQSVR
jgi:hypothetical protein